VIRFALLLLAALLPCVAGSQPLAASEEESTPRIIEVAMDMNGEGTGFSPSTITARRGDLLRFVNRDGMDHNVSFPKRRNPEGANLPPVGPMLETEGEIYELVVELDPGSYYFQCDPHVSMGMAGRLIVE
jgi:plastocyanin